VLAVAVARADQVTVIDDADEAALLTRLDQHLAGLAPGVIITWNGARFDLPYLSTRADRIAIALDLTLQADPSRTHPSDRDRNPIDRLGGVRARWGRHRHLDVYRCYRADVGRALGMTCSLKAVAALVGLAPIEVDAAQVHLLDRARLEAYVASDAACTRELARRRWANASAAIDRVLP